MRAPNSFTASCVRRSSRGETEIIHRKFARGRQALLVSKRQGYVYHTKRGSPVPAVFRNFIEQVRGLTGLIYGRRMYGNHALLEAIEMAVRAALHQAGAAALSELLHFAAPTADQRTVPCDCGHRAT